MKNRTTLPDRVKKHTCDNGDVTDCYEYSAFGTVQSRTGSDSNRIMFSSEPNDEDSGLIYLRHRYYEPDSGRFVSRDPDYKVNKQHFAYCRNNPVYFTDPMGMREEISPKTWRYKNYPAYYGDISQTINDYVKIYKKEMKRSDSQFCCIVYANALISKKFYEFANSRGIRIIDIEVRGYKSPIPLFNFSPTSYDHFGVVMLINNAGGKQTNWWYTDYRSFTKSIFLDVITYDQRPNAVIISPEGNLTIDTKPPWEHAAGYHKPDKRNNNEK